MPANRVESRVDHESTSKPRRFGPAMLIALVIAAWMAIAGTGGPIIGKLSQVSKNDASTFLPESAESVQANEKLRELDDSGALPALITLQGGGVFEKAFGGGTAGGPPTEQSPGGPPTDGSPGGPPGAAYADGIISQITVDGTPLADLLAANQPALAIPANDASGVLLVVPLDATKMAEVTADDDRFIALTVDALRDQLPEASGAETIYVTGPAGYSADLGAAFGGIDGILLVVTLSVVLLILLIVYRSLVLPFMVLLSSVSGLALAGLLVYWLAKEDIIVLNGQSQGILSILVIGAATDYSLLLVSRYREELERHDRPLDAMKVAWRACVEPILASAGTVIAGLLCLLLSDLNSNSGLGPVGSIGIAASVTVSLTLLPALLLLGRWVFWPRIPKEGEHRTEAHGIWRRIAAFVERRPRQVWMVVAAVLIAFCFAIPSFKADGTTDAEIFLTQVDAVDGQQVLDESFDAGAADPLRVVIDAQQAEQLVTDLQATDGVSSASVSEGQTSDGMTEVVVVPEDPDESQQLVEPVRDVAHALDDDSLVGGEPAVKYDTKETSQRDLVVIIPIVLVVVLAILMMLLRAVVAPLMLIVATVISFGTALGVSALVFNHLFDFPGADPSVPLIGFIFLVALGVDYSIFLMTRAREEVAKLGPKDGVTRALTVTGGVITSAGVVLAATFATLGVVPLLFLVQLAFIVAFGVLLDTLIVRTLLVPAMAIDAGRWTWWPSRLYRAPRPAGQ
ncbi:MMPL family transporter [Blastococcus sp. Marseille-P5729]|uniref:MMPL family transporter n=1 Tax=Blastococcus sp. Marseille-P5729 TaxID=2086582 RepID=UPI000D0E9D94|nr:MMPL family transporter [Blastococcus sp. Marseille-P5729]